MGNLDTLSPEIRSLRPVKVLESSLNNGRLAHAILLKGENLNTLESISLSLAQSLLKTEAGPTSHPDFFTLRPTKRSRSIPIGDRQSPESNSVRGLLKELQQTANQGGYKVAVIYEADRMNAQATNALLKTLEEPPPQTILLLLSTRPYDLLDTIRSRCFQFRIPSQITSQNDSDWIDWKADYKDWIKYLCLRPQDGRKSPHEPILKLYGLITRFAKIADALSNTIWKTKNELLDERITEEEKVALEVGVKKGIRDSLLIEMELATRQAGIDLSHEIPFPALKVSQVVEELENLQGLLTLNMKDETALEAFFLKSMKIWTR